MQIKKRMKVLVRAVLRKGTARSMIRQSQPGQSSAFAEPGSCCTFHRLGKSTPVSPELQPGERRGWENGYRG